MSGVLSHWVLVVLLIGVLVAAGDAYAQTTWYVDDDNWPAPGSGTMADPFCMIQAGIDKAKDEDTVVAQDGTYNEAIDFKGKAITLRSSGGAAVTTIDATGLSASVVRCVSGEGPDTVLEGFTITGGTGTDPGTGWLYGGGMYNRNSSPTVTRCTFSGNTADRDGGGMFNFLSSPTVTSCTFSGNTGAYDGGGMYNEGSDSTVSECTFSGNHADSDGGGMGNWYSSPTVTQCTFSGNTAVGGVGMYNVDGSNPTVTQCTFSGNTATSGGATTWGGGMFNTRFSSPTVTHCTFSGNTGFLGAGMHNGASNPTVTQCTFSGNTADYGYGGGMRNSLSSPTVTSCTFSGNTAYEGGGMFNLGSSPTVTNCILWGDTPEEIHNHDDPNFPSAATVTYSDVQGGTAQPWFGTGCLDADPLFVDADGPDDTFGTNDDNLRLSGGSPCIDAGDNAAVPGGLTTDLDGNPRISHGTVDMGAYERQDDDGDGVLDGSDVCPGFDDNADADNDGVPDGCDDCPDTPTCATNIDANGCAIDSDGDGSPDGCPPAEQEPQGCCGATGPVAPLGLAIGMLLLSRFGGQVRRRR